jgi:phage baseplate assembly protein V
MRTPEDTPTDADQLIRFGTIASVDLGAARCTVSLDDDAVTGPVRWLEARMGQTRTWSPPSEGEQVLVLCPAGEIGAAVALRGLVSDAFPPPGNDLLEIMQFKDGAALSYDTDNHALAIILPNGGSLRVVAPGGVKVEGDLACTGAIKADGDVVAGTVSLQNHLTTGVTGGTGISGKPQP